MDQATTAAERAEEAAQTLCRVLVEHPTDGPDVYLVLGSVSVAVWQLRNTVELLKRSITANRPTATDDGTDPTGRCDAVVVSLGAATELLADAVTALDGAQNELSHLKAWS